MGSQLDSSNAQSKLVFSGLDEQKEPQASRLGVMQYANEADGNSLARPSRTSSDENASSVSRRNLENQQIEVSNLSSIVVESSRLSTNSRAVEEIDKAKSQEFSGTSRDPHTHPSKLLAPVLRSRRIIYRIGRDVAAYLTEAPSRISRLSMHFMGRLTNEDVLEPPQFRPPVPLDKKLPEPPYHIFTSRQKHHIVFLLSAVAMLSPLSLGLYLPTLASVSLEFNVPTHNLTLSVSAYIFFQAAAAALFSAYGEEVPRRSALIAMSVVTMSANIALAFSKTFPVVVFLQILQSIGSSLLASTATAMIRDISLGEERELLIRDFDRILLLTCLSPSFGGILTSSGSFRPVFGFLFALTTLIFLIIILIVPETLRRIAGDGTVRLTRLQQPLLHHFISSSETSSEFNSERSFFSTDKPNMKELITRSLTQLNRNREVALALLTSAVLAAYLAMLLVTFPTFLNLNFRASTLQIGFAFLPAASGFFFSLFATPYLVAHDLNIVTQRYADSHNLSNPSKIAASTAKSYITLPDFPIVRARLRSAWWLGLIFITTFSSYGFAFKTRSIALPLILHFFISATVTTLLSTVSLLCLDLWQRSGTDGDIHMFLRTTRLGAAAFAVAIVFLFINILAPEGAFLLLGMSCLWLVFLGAGSWLFFSKRQKQRQLRAPLDLA